MLTNIAKAFALLTVVSSSIVAVGCAAPTADMQDEEQGETGSYLLAGPVLSASQVAAYVRQAGFPESMVGKMVCTAKYESSFYSKASNGSHYGLFQISKMHLGKTSGCVSTVSGVYEPGNNAKCAYGVYKAQGLGAWEAYKSHKSECDRYKAPGSAAIASTDTPSNVPIPTPRPDDLVSGDSPGNAQQDLTGGGCYSASYKTMTDENVCVQSAMSSDKGVWFQCHEGKWYRGGNASTGPYGACKSTMSLSQASTMTASVDMNLEAADDDSTDE